MMSTNREAPGFFSLLGGEGDPLLVFLARFGSLAISFLVILQLFVWLHI